MEDKVIIFDTTLRDGEQSPGAALAVDEKIDLARQLERLGVDVIEAGFPFSSPGDFEAVRRIGEEINNCTVCGLARTSAGDIDSAWKALHKAKKPRIHVFVSSSDVHMKNILRQSHEDVLAGAVAMIARAKSYCPDIEFSPMDATRSDPDFVCQLVEAAVTAGATTVNIPDTVGYTDPAEFDKFLAYIFDKVKNIDQAIVSVHCHNDLGMATANSLTAVKRGARQIECTINGIGERAGNAALEEVVMALHTRQDFYGPTTNIDLSEIYKSSRMVSSYTGLFVQPNKAIVGANAFAHESGIHQDGVLKERSTFEIMDPRDVGVGDSALVLGKHSGRHAFKSRLADLGYELSAEDLNRVFLRFKKLADQKKVVVDADLEAIVADEIRSPAEIFHLEQLQVTCGDHSIPTASVRLITPNGDIVADAALGNGPVDAIYKAINRLIQAPNSLIEFSVHSVTGGLDAVAETTIKIQSDGHVYSGRGASTDIILASAKAYMNALNKLLAFKDRETTAEATSSKEGQ